MSQSLDSTLVICDLDNLLLDADGNLTQVIRDVLQLFSSRGGKLTVFSQRTPRAVRALLGSVRLSAPALVCGGTMAYHFADGSRWQLCSFADQDEDLLQRLPSAAGVGIARVSWGASGVRGGVRYSLAPPYFPARYLRRRNAVKYGSFSTEPSRPTLPPHSLIPQSMSG